MHRSPFPRTAHSSTTHSSMLKYSMTGVMLGTGFGTFFGAQNNVLPAPRFTVRTDFTIPPLKPRPQKKFGGYCFKAVCEVYTDDGRALGCPVAKVTGYDESIVVGKNTERRCRRQVRGMRGGAFRCSEAQVVILPRGPNEECSGQYFFTMGDTTKKLV